MSRTTHPQALAIVPARGGSKGIPGKNVQPVGGKPLIGWTIEAAADAESVERVIVSTDDPHIGRTATAFGAEVVQRPQRLSGDEASSESALLHALGHLRETEEYEPEILVFLQCTAPLMTAEDIDGTVQALHQQQADTALAVTEFHYFLWRRNERGEAAGINHDAAVRPLRQNREPQYLETGAVYVMRTEGFLRVRHRFFGKTALYVMPPERCLEIDDPVDVDLADVLLRDRHRQQRRDQLPTTPESVVFDFDGVFTDNRVLVDQFGHESTWCHRGDGWGIADLKRLGVRLLVLSAEKNPVVQARCDKLNIPCIHGQDDKAAVLQAWLRESGIEPARTVYLGNDVNDVACLQLAGCGAVVADAHVEAKRAARLILESRGGCGAVRELTDLIRQRLKG